jgi:hypothetical protein
LGCRPPAKRCTQQAVIKGLLLLLVVVVNKRATRNTS